MPSGSRSAAADHLRSLFEVQLRLRLEKLTGIADRLRRNEARRFDYEMLEIEGHRIAGTAETFGAAALGDAALALELSLRNGVRDSHELLDVLMPVIETAGRALAGLPRDDRAEEVGESVDAACTRGRHTFRPSILVASDRHRIWDQLCVALSDVTDITHVRTGSAALDVAGIRRFDLILIDLRLPDQNGLTVLQTFRAFETSLQAPIVMVASGRDASDVSRMVAAGVQDYLIEPFQPHEARACVQAVLGRQRPHVLVADDDPLVREIFRDKFEQRGVNVHLAGTGTEALKAARLVRPHAILLDRAMPSMDGMQVLASLREDNSTHSIPIVILSARGNLKEIRDGYSNGADDYFVKPFLPDRVVDRCLKYVELREVQPDAPGH